MTAEITQIWMLIPENTSHEIRAFRSSDNAVRCKVFNPDKFASITDFKHAFQHYAIELNNQGFNTYMTLNPVRKDFSGDVAASDADIAYRDLLLVDIDRAGDTQNPATDEELRHAKELAEEVSAFLKDEGWCDPIKMMSGNGVHLYYILKDMPNDDEARVLVMKTLYILADRFNNKRVQIDRSVSNASRLTKIPGTVMRKGTESHDRPYRMAVIL